MSKIYDVSGPATTEGVHQSAADAGEKKSNDPDGGDESSEFSFTPETSPEPRHAWSSSGQLGEWEKVRGSQEDETPVSRDPMDNDDSPEWGSWRARDIPVAGSATRRAMWSADEGDERPDGAENFDQQSPASDAAGGTRGAMDGERTPEQEEEEEDDGQGNGAEAQEGEEAGEEEGEEEEEEEGEEEGEEEEEEEEPMPAPPPKASPNTMAKKRSLLWQWATMGGIVVDTHKEQEHEGGGGGRGIEAAARMDSQADGGRKLAGNSSAGGGLPTTRKKLGLDGPGTSARASEVSESQTRQALATPLPDLISFDDFDASDMTGSLHQLPPHGSTPLEDTSSQEVHPSSSGPVPPNGELLSSVNSQLTSVNAKLTFFDSVSLMGTGASDERMLSQHLIATGGNGRERTVLANRELVGHDVDDEEGHSNLLGNASALCRPEPAECEEFLTPVHSFASLADAAGGAGGAGGGGTGARDLSESDGENPAGPTLPAANQSDDKASRGKGGTTRSYLSSAPAAAGTAGSRSDVSGDSTASYVASYVASRSNGLPLPPVLSFESLAGAVAGPDPYADSQPHTLPAAERGSSLRSSSSTAGDDESAGGESPEWSVAGSSLRTHGGLADRHVAAGPWATSAGEDYEIPSGQGTPGFGAGSAGAGSEGPGLGRLPSRYLEAPAGESDVPVSEGLTNGAPQELGSVLEDRGFAGASLTSHFMEGQPIPPLPLQLGAVPALSAASGATSSKPEAFHPPPGMPAESHLALHREEAQEVRDVTGPEMPGNSGQHHLRAALGSTGRLMAAGTASNAGGRDAGALGASDAELALPPPLAWELAVVPLAPTATAAAAAAAAGGEETRGSIDVATAAAASAVAAAGATGAAPAAAAAYEDDDNNDDYEEDEVEEEERRRRESAAAEEEAHVAAFLAAVCSPSPPASPAKSFFSSSSPPLSVPGSPLAYVAFPLQWAAGVSPFSSPSLSAPPSPPPPNVPPHFASRSPPPLTAAAAVGAAAAPVVPLLASSSPPSAAAAAAAAAAATCPCASPIRFVAMSPAASPGASPSPGKSPSKGSPGVRPRRALRDKKRVKERLQAWTARNARQSLHLAPEQGGQVAAQSGSTATTTEEDSGVEAAAPGGKGEEAEVSSLIPVQQMEGPERSWSKPAHADLPPVMGNPQAGGQALAPVTATGTAAGGGGDDTAQSRTLKTLPANTFQGEATHQQGPRAKWQIPVTTSTTSSSSASVLRSCQVSAPPNDFAAHHAADASDPLALTSSSSPGVATPPGGGPRQRGRRTGAESAELAAMRAQHELLSEDWRALERKWAQAKEERDRAMHAAQELRSTLRDYAGTPPFWAANHGGRSRSPPPVRPRRSQLVTPPSSPPIPPRKPSSPLRRSSPGPLFLSSSSPGNKGSPGGVPGPLTGGGARRALAARGSPAGIPARAQETQYPISPQKVSLSSGAASREAPRNSPVSTLPGVISAEVAQLALGEIVEAVQVLGRQPSNTADHLSSPPRLPAGRPLASPPPSHRLPSRSVSPCKLLLPAGATSSSPASSSGHLIAPSSSSAKKRSLFTLEHISNPIHSPLKAIDGIAISSAGPSPGNPNPNPSANFNPNPNLNPKMSPGIGKNPQPSPSKRPSWAAAGHVASPPAAAKVAMADAATSTAGPSEGHGSSGSPDAARWRDKDDLSPGEIVGGDHKVAKPRTPLLATAGRRQLNFSAAVEVAAPPGLQSEGAERPGDETGCTEEEALPTGVVTHVRQVAPADGLLLAAQRKATRDEGAKAGNGFEPQVEAAANSPVPPHERDVVAKSREPGAATSVALTAEARGGDPEDGEQMIKQREADGEVTSSPEGRAERRPDQAPAVNGDAFTDCQVEERKRGADSEVETLRAQVYGLRSSVKRERERRLAERQRWRQAASQLRLALGLPPREGAAADRELPVGGGPVDESPGTGDARWAWPKEEEEEEEEVEEGGGGGNITSFSISRGEPTDATGGILVEEPVDTSFDVPGGSLLDGLDEDVRHSALRFAPAWEVGEDAPAVVLATERRRGSPMRGRHVAGLAGETLPSDAQSLLEALGTLETSDTSREASPERASRYTRRGQQNGSSGRREGRSRWRAERPSGASRARRHLAGEGEGGSLAGSSSEGDVGPGLGVAPAASAGRDDGSALGTANGPVGESDRWQDRSSRHLDVKVVPTGTSDFPSASRNSPKLTSGSAPSPRQATPGSHVAPVPSQQQPSSMRPGGVSAGVAAMPGSQVASRKALSGSSLRVRPAAAAPPSYTWGSNLSERALSPLPLPLRTSAQHSGDAGSGFHKSDGVRRELQPQQNQQRQQRPTSPSRSLPLSPAIVTGTPAGASSAASPGPALASEAQAAPAGRRINAASHSHGHSASEVSAGSINDGPAIKPAYSTSSAELASQLASQGGGRAPRKVQTEIVEVVEEVRDSATWPATVLTGGAPRDVRRQKRPSREPEAFATWEDQFAFPSPPSLLPMSSPSASTSTSTSAAPANADHKEKRRTLGDKVSQSLQRLGFSRGKSKERPVAKKAPEPESSQEVSSERRQVAAPHAGDAGGDASTGAGIGEGVFTSKRSSSPLWGRNRRASAPGKKKSPPKETRIGRGLWRA